MKISNTYKGSPVIGLLEFTKRNKNFYIDFISGIARRVQKTGHISSSSKAPRKGLYSLMRQLAIENFRNITLSCSFSAGY
jgi:hypothetical protein